MFLISLDFELYWGVHDARGKEYFSNIKRVHSIVPQVIAIFDEYNVKSTWATVGLIALNSKRELTSKLEEIDAPSYENQEFSPFGKKSMESIDDELLFAPNLIRLIASTDNAELASHTLSHYYVLEPGQTEKQFENDCRLTNLLFDMNYKVQPKSIVFPRNQVNKNYFSVLLRNGIKYFRGTPKHWAYKTESRSERSILRRLYRLIDCYLPITQNFGCKIEQQGNSELYDVPATLFFRPYSNRLRLLEPLKIWRIKYAMKKAAKKGEIFHLWWHPHNFASNIDMNLNNLRKVLEYYQFISKKYSWYSYKMEEVLKELNNEKSSSDREKFTF